MRRLSLLAVVITLALIASVGLSAQAQSGSYRLAWSTISNGGTIASTGGGYTLSGTVGQAMVGAATGNGYTIRSGFWGSNTTWSSYRRFLPVALQQRPSPAAPNLIASLRLSPDKRAFAAGERVTITASITNTGDALAEPFWVDLLITPSRPPTAANMNWNDLCRIDPCFGIAWQVEDGLEPGKSVTLSSRSFPPGYSIWPGWFVSGTTDLYLYADSWNPDASFGAVAENNEADNRAELHGLTVTGENPTQISRIRTKEVLPRPRER